MTTCTVTHISPPAADDTDPALTRLHAGIARMLLNSGIPASVLRGQAAAGPEWASCAAIADAMETARVLEVSR